MRYAQIIIIILTVGLLAYQILCPPVPIPIPIPIPVLTPNQILLDMGRQWTVQSVRTGKPHSTLQKAAEAHAAYQARVQTQGHQDWETRVIDLQRKMPGYVFTEVANESWPGQDVKAAANEMYRSWRLSSGHWAAVNGRCNYYGYAMCRGANDTWYACGIFAK